MTNCITYPSDGHELLSEARDAHQAIVKAITAVSKMTVHGRDFREQHAARLAKLEDARKEIMEVYRALSDQVPNKRTA